MFLYPHTFLFNVAQPRDITGTVYLVVKDKLRICNPQMSDVEFKPPVPLCMNASSMQLSFIA